MNKRLYKELDIFITFVHLPRLSNNTRTVFLAYLKWEMDNGLEDFVWQHIIDLEIFFGFLDAIERIREEQQELALKKQAKKEG